MGWFRRPVRRCPFYHDMQISWPDPGSPPSDCRIPNLVSAKPVHSSSTNCTVRNLHTSGIDAGHVQ